MQIIFKQFIAKWGDASLPSQPCDEQSIASAEQALRTRFPDLHRRFLVEVGKLWVPYILSSVVAEEADLPSLQDLLSANEAVETTNGWLSAGMPNDLIAVATDAGGNCLCFRRSIEPLTDAPVYLWDHDFDETREVFSSFLAMIQAYVSLKKHA
jgi:hypothetical protein